MAKSSDVTSLDELIRESEEAIKRLEAAQRGTKGLPLLTRINLHLRKNSSAFINIAMAGSVLVVAVGRLAQQRQHEAEKESWEEERKKLTVERNRMQQQVHAYQLSTESLVRHVEAAAGGDSRHLADDLHDILQKHKEAQAQLQQHSPAVMALLQSAEAARQQQQAQQEQQQQAQQPGPKIMV